MLLNECLRHVMTGGVLTEPDAANLADALIDGRLGPAPSAALLTALRLRGESADEIAAFAAALRSHVRPVGLDPAGIVDTCGTGGDGRGTFNVSTVAAIVAAAAGCRVAKHGNRAVSSACGSADVLARLGVPVELSPADAVRSIESIGIGFFLAPRYHDGLQRLAELRRELGFRTILNIVGPLLNPIGVRRQVIGVFERRLTSVVGEVLLRQGVDHCLVVHGADGTDEITPAGLTHACEVRAGRMVALTIEPQSLGVPRCVAAELLGGDAATNAWIALEVLRGQPGAARNMVLLNAGAAIYVGGRAATLEQGVRAAARAIDTGRAFQKLVALQTFAAGVAA
ncbi:MAG: anthranilate phosphoribosyltransferase [Phycisphaerae bacterium]